MLRRLRSLGLLTLLLLGHVTARAEEPITVAVAANLQTAYSELASRFQQQSGLIAQASFGATGKLATQIRQGAPFHLLLAADNDTPHQLARDGFALQNPQAYAIGTLVIWTTRDFALDNWQVLLQSPSVQHIAIADPKTAPYGREAARAIEHYKLLRKIESKLVYGESIGQTNQFILSGAADIGFTAKASVIGNSAGRWQELPADSYSAIVQAAVLLKHAENNQRKSAEQFYAFLFSPEARTILEKYDYRLPTP